MQLRLKAIIVVKITSMPVHSSFMGSVHSINLVIAIQTQLCWLWLNVILIDEQKENCSVLMTSCIAMDMS